MYIEDNLDRFEQYEADMERERSKRLKEINRGLRDCEPWEYETMMNNKEN